MADVNSPIPTVWSVMQTIEQQASAAVFELGRPGTGLDFNSVASVSVHNQLL